MLNVCSAIFGAGAYNLKFWHCLKAAAEDRPQLALVALRAFGAVINNHLIAGPLGQWFLWRKGDRLYAGHLWAFGLAGAVVEIIVWIAGLGQTGIDPGEAARNRLGRSLSSTIGRPLLRCRGPWVG